MIDRQGQGSRRPLLGALQVLFSRHSFPFFFLPCSQVLASLFIYVSYNEPLLQEACSDQFRVFTARVSVIAQTFANLS